MCGIVGIFAFTGSAPRRDLWSDLVNHLAHRGPDEGGLWAQGPFFFGHRRLSIIDLATGAQPMATPDDELAVTFNGEIYNHRELRAELQRAGYRFTTSSDTEVLLHGYRHWGRSLPERLVGMFAFALADTRRGELFLARDRFGEKPLLLLATPGYVAFASELRPLAALSDAPLHLNEAAFGRYLIFNYVPGADTLAAGVERLAPASWRSYSSRGVEDGVYWRPPTVARAFAGSAAEALEDWRPRFDRAVRQTLTSDVPVAVWLSGGIDSSLVAESAVRQGGLDRAYVLDMPDERYTEREAAKAVARRLGLALEVVPLAPPSGDDLLALVEHADDPLADSSALAVWSLARHVGGKHKVVLGGDGGDEVFGGYLTYGASRLHRRWIAPLPGFMRRCLRALGERIPTSEGKVAFSYKLWRFLRAAPLATSRAHFTWNGSWTPEAAARLAASEAVRRGALGGLDGIAERHAPGARDSLLDLQRADVGDYLPNDILAKVDRMSMAHGVEVRAPFLDPELASWGLTLPDRLKIGRRGELKTLLRFAARQAFGPAIADRPKQGFSIPVHAWIRGPLRETVRELLSTSSLAKVGVLDPAAVERVFVAHLEGRRSYGFELWGLAVFVAWHRQRIQRRPAPPRAARLVDHSPRSASSRPA